MNDLQSLILETTREILGKAGFSFSASWDTGAVPWMNVSGDDLALFVGSRGQYVEALEHLVRLSVLRKVPAGAILPDFILDINEFRKAHTDRILKIAEEVAQRVQATGRAESLAPMNAHERKIIHSHLATYASLATESIGSEPNRRIVIKMLSL